MIFWDAKRQATPAQMIPSVNEVLLQALPLVGSCCAAAAARLGALLTLKEESGLCNTAGEDGIFPLM